MTYTKTLTAALSIVSLSLMLQPSFAEQTPVSSAKNTCQPVHIDFQAFAHKFATLPGASEGYTILDNLKTPGNDSKCCIDYIKSAFKQAGIVVPTNTSMATNFPLENEIGSILTLCMYPTLPTPWVDLYAYAMTLPHPLSVYHALSQVMSTLPQKDLPQANSCIKNFNQVFSAVQLPNQPKKPAGVTPEFWYQQKYCQLTTGQQGQLNVFAQKGITSCINSPASSSK